MSLRFSEEELKKHLAKGNQRGNHQNNRASAVANVEQHSINAAQRQNADQETLPPVVIRFTHYRRKLADVDNFATKHYVDSLVKNGLLRDDSAKEVKEVRHRQVKIEMWEEERMVIELIDEQDNYP